MVNDPSNAGGLQRARNVAEALRIADLLAEAATSVAALDAQLLLQRLTQRSRADLLAFGEQVVDATTVGLFRAAVTRRAAGEPLAYITGVREFWSLPLVVTPAVLVPRPETELLVELCLAQLDAAPHLVADLGTGSGAIAIALAKERPEWMLIATDASLAALEVAAINRERLGIPNLALRAGSWCEALPTDPFDAIVSNPPYIAPDHPALQALTHEPRTALAADDDGYSDLLRIAAGAREHLKSGGLLLLEHGAGQGARLRHELGALGYPEARTHRDLAGLDRVTAAIWP
ncbi:MAG: peptide chain release factor N(5)-glutamine methyltransferase [Pseudomonadota bacterium]